MTIHGLNLLGCGTCQGHSHSVYIVNGMPTEHARSNWVQMSEELFVLEQTAVTCSLRPTMFEHRGAYLQRTQQLPDRETIVCSDNFSGMKKSSKE